MGNRVVKKSYVRGTWPLPVGIHFLSHEPCSGPKYVLISTVQLDDGHLEDQLGICEPETGFETMVFLGGCTFFSLYTRRYETRQQAMAGHKKTVKDMLAKKLPLAISLPHYCAWEELAEAPTEEKKRAA